MAGCLIKKKLVKYGYGIQSIYRVRAGVSPSFCRIYAKFVFLSSLLFRLLKVFLHRSTPNVVSFIALCAFNKQLPVYQ